MNQDWWMVLFVVVSSGSKYTPARPLNSKKKSQLKKLTEGKRGGERNPRHQD
jgi:hypothetical protein